MEKLLQINQPPSRQTSLLTDQDVLKNIFYMMLSLSFDVKAVVLLSTRRRDAVSRLLNQDSPPPSPAAREHNKYINHVFWSRKCNS